jgi:predicted transcriptional regulator
VTHNLGVSPLLVSVYVEGDDGKYRNDIVAVEETSLNVLTVSLTESRKVKVAVMSPAALA